MSISAAPSRPYYVGTFQYNLLIVKPLISHQAEWDSGGEKVGPTIMRLLRNSLRPAFCRVPDAVLIIMEFQKIFN